jgi:hypothetical protein
MTRRFRSETARRCDELCGSSSYRLVRSPARDFNAKGAKVAADQPVTEERRRRQYQAPVLAGVPVREDGQAATGTSAPHGSVENRGFENCPARPIVGRGPEARVSIDASLSSRVHHLVASTRKNCRSSYRADVVTGELAIVGVAVAARTGAIGPAPEAGAPHA